MYIDKGSQPNVTLSLDQTIKRTLSAGSKPLNAIRNQERLQREEYLVMCCESSKMHLSSDFFIALTALVCANQKKDS